MIESKSAIAAEAERCARIAESQIVGAEGNSRIEGMVRAMRVHSSKTLTSDANRARCLNIARSQLHGDEADERIQGVIDAIESGRRDLK